MRLRQAGGTLGTWWIPGVVPSAGRRALGQVQSIVLQHTHSKIQTTQICGCWMSFITDEHRKEAGAKEKVTNLNPSDRLGKCEWVWEIPSPQRQLLLRCSQARPPLEEGADQLLLTVKMHQGAQMLNQQVCPVRLHSQLKGNFNLLQIWQNFWKFGDHWCWLR